jgi:hypothetical protein
MTSVHACLQVTGLHEACTHGSHGWAKEKSGIKIISLIAIKGVYSSCVSSRPMYWFLRNSPTFATYTQNRLMFVVKEK